MNRKTNIKNIAKIYLILSLGNIIYPNKDPIEVANDKWMGVAAQRDTPNGNISPNILLFDNKNPKRA